MLYQKKERLLKVCKSLDVEFVELFKKAEEKATNLVMKANGIMRKSEERAAKCHH